MLWGLEKPGKSKAGIAALGAAQPQPEASSYPGHSTAAHPHPAQVYTSLKALLAALFLPQSPAQGRIWGFGVLPNCGFINFVSPPLNTVEFQEFSFTCHLRGNDYC